jgi:hypothetical protein
VVVGVVLPLVVAACAMAVDYAISPSAGAYDLAWTAAATSALIGMLAARSHARSADRGRYTFWALATGCWLLGQIAWDIFDVAGFPASPNLADAGWWGFALLVIASTLRLPPAPRSLKVILALEMAPLVTASIALCLAELWASAAHSHLALAPKLSALAYPSLYASATILTLHAMLGGRLRGLRNRALRLMLAGIATRRSRSSSGAEISCAGRTPRGTRRSTRCGCSGSLRSRSADSGRLTAPRMRPRLRVQAAAERGCRPACSSSSSGRSSPAG